jgi:hypothetical protein
MDHKSIRFIGFVSLMFGTAAVIGQVVLTFGPWTDPSLPTARTLLAVSFLAFAMIGQIAVSAASLLEAHADRIATLERELALRRSA